MQIGNTLLHVILSKKNKNTMRYEILLTPVTMIKIFVSRYCINSPPRVGQQSLNFHSCFLGSKLVTTDLVWGWITLRKQSLPSFFFLDLLKGNQLRERMCCWYEPCEEDERHNEVRNVDPDQQILCRNVLRQNVCKDRKLQRKITK